MNKVRIYVPFNKSTGRPNEDIPGGEGHYEIQLSGTMTLLGKNYTDPVISYGKMGSNDSRGKIEICNCADRSVEAYQLLCTWPIAVNGNPETVMQNWLQQYSTICNDVPEDAIKANTDVYTVVGAHEQYSKEASNCFMVTAEWCSLMGNDTLKDILEEKNHFSQYTAWPMFLMNHTEWYFEKLVTK